MTLPILYSFRRCPYAIRARLALLSSGTVCELREVSLANKPQAMITASPKATVPVMVLPDGIVLEESLDIMSYALNQSDPLDWRAGTDPAMMALVTRNDTVFKDYLDHYKYPDRHDGDHLDARDKGFAILQDLNARLAHFSSLTGSKANMIDMAIFPFVRQFAAVDESWFYAQNTPNLHNWLRGHLASDIFTAAMEPYALWHEGAERQDFPKT